MNSNDFKQYLTLGLCEFYKVGSQQGAVIIGEGSFVKGESVLKDILGRPMINVRRGY
jgi:hypothetical protein